MPTPQRLDAVFWPIGKPRVDHLRGAVWEVRTSLTNRIARILFAVEGRQMLLLHGFIKKTQRTTNEDIKLAEKRFKEWQRGET
jgi:phage-related protein